jgi:outer membrane translocation and assembly module TamA
MSEKSPPVGQGDKYTMTKLLLKATRGQTVEAWIRVGRRQSPPRSYYALADDLNALFRQEHGRDAPRVTYESIRRWDPDGEFQQAVRARQQAGQPAADPAAAPPVQFQPPEMAQEVE